MLLCCNVLLVGLSLTGCKSGKEELLGTGTFEAKEILVSAQAEGEIIEWSIDDGMMVKENQIVGAIDSTQLYLQKLSLESSNKGVRVSTPNINTQTAALQRQIDELKRERERTQKLFEADVATQKQLDDINSSLRVLESQLSAQRSALSKSTQQISAQSSTIEIQIAQLEDRLEKCRIKSPINGTILESYVDKGELAGAGRPLFRVAALDTLILRAYIPFSELNTLQLNEKVQVSVDGSKGEMKSYEGIVTWISAKAEFTPKSVQTKSERENRVYAVKVKVPNDGYLRIGMYGELRKLSTNEEKE